MPTGATVEENVVDNLVTTLEAIATPAFNHDVADVRDMEGTAADQIQLPAILVFHGGTETTFLPQKNQKRLTLFLVLAVAANADDPRQEIQRLVSDVEVALHTTHRRGGNAQDTRVVASEIAARIPAQTAVQEATLTTQVVFAHPHGDPTTPK